MSQHADPSAHRGRHGRPRVGVREVARRAGVAASTVSRVLSDHPDVSPETRAQVLEVANALGYRPNGLGQMLRQGFTRTIGFCVSDIANPLFAQITRGAEMTLSKHGYSLLLSNSMSDPALELKNLQALDQRRVEGLLLSVTSETDPAMLAVLRDFQGPLVAIDRELHVDPTDSAALAAAPAGATVSAVLSDHAVGIRAAVAALAAAGHRHIALLQELAELRPGRVRAQAATAAAAELGITCRIHPAGPEGLSPGQIAAILTAPDAPTAVIAGHNQILIRLLAALRSAGLRYPDDVSVVTCDDVPLMEFFEPALAVVRRDPARLGAAAAELLLEHLVDADAPGRQVVLPTEFVPGASVRQLT